MADGDKSEGDGTDGSTGSGGVEPGVPASGNQTMQIDAFVEELDDGAGVPGDAVLAQVLADSRAGEGAAGSLPPPLPPKKVGKGTVIAGALVVLLAVGGGIFLGMSFLEEEPPATGTEADAPEAATTGEEDALQGDEQDDQDDQDDPQGDGMGDGEDEGAFVPIHLDEVTIPHPADEIPDQEGVE